jgi:hypothetical protein
MEMSCQLHASASLPLGKELSAPIRLEAGLASEPVWTLRRREKSLTPAGNRTPISQPVARRYTDWALSVHTEIEDTQGKYIKRRDMQ